MNNAPAVLDVGMTTITWTITDDSRNTATCDQIILVEDSMAPLAPEAPDGVTVECAADVPAPIDLTATDNCDANITVSPADVITAGSCDNSFIIERTWTFTDDNGNSSSVSQFITVEDTTDPVAPSAPADFTGQCSGDVPMPVDLTAVDNLSLIHIS